MDNENFPRLLSYLPEDAYQQRYWTRAIMNMARAHFDRANYDKAQEWYACDIVSFFQHSG